MLFLIRETLVIHWGKNISVFDRKGAGKEEAATEVACRDFVNCEYCMKGSRKSSKKKE